MHTSGISRRYYELGGSEAGYSKTDFFYNVLAGLAVVAAVALTLFTFGAAAPVIIGAVAVGSAVVIGKGVLDYHSGEVSSTASYMLAGFVGAVTGAVLGAAVHYWPNISKSISDFASKSFALIPPLIVYSGGEAALSGGLAISGQAIINAGLQMGAIATGVAIGDILVL